VLRPLINRCSKTYIFTAHPTSVVFFVRSRKVFFPKDCRPSFQTTPLTESRPQPAPLCLLFFISFVPNQGPHISLSTTRMHTNVIFYLEMSTSILILQDKFLIFVGFFSCTSLRLHKKRESEPQPSRSASGGRPPCLRMHSPGDTTTDGPRHSHAQVGMEGVVRPGAPLGGGGVGFRCSEFVCDRGSQQTGQMHYRRFVQRREQIKTTIAEDKSWNV